MKITNKRAKAFVQDRKVFKGSNLFSEQWRGVYAVYSYGYHFPIYAYVNGVWYENTDRYSPSTARHQSQCRPLGNTVAVSTEQIKEVINKAELDYRAA